MTIHIPQELIETAQWINWRSEERDGKQTKVPVNPHNGNKADVTDPACFGTFQLTLKNAQQFGVGMGFVLTQNDPFVCIDLDKPEGKVDPIHFGRIYDNFNAIIADAQSYTEFSPNGGVHIWLKANVPANGVRSSSDCLEMYSTGRFMTMTNNPFNGVALPLSQRDELANVIHRALDRRGTDLSDIAQEPYNGTAEETIDRIKSWSNAAKFYQLATTPITGKDIDHSAVDQGVMNFLVLATKNVQAAIAAFNLTPRAQREKWRDRPDYRLRTAKEAFRINKMTQDEPRFAELVATIKAEVENQNHVKAALAQSMANEVAYVSPSEPEPAPFVADTPAPAQDTPATPPAQVVQGDDGYTHGIGPYKNPGGLFGDVMEYLYRSSFAPIPETAFAGALGLMSGICGRAYNYYGLGLNVYAILIANSGTGKNAALVGPGKLMQQVAVRNRDFNQFVGERYVSAQALSKAFTTRPSFCSFIDEFGETLKRMLDPREASSSTNMIGPYMELYTCSGRGGSMPAIVHSKAEESTKKVASPSFSMLGVSVPKTFYESITPESISKGLIPRMSIIEVKKRPKFDDLNRHGKSIEPPSWLIDKLFGLCESASRINGSWPLSQIQVTDDEDARALWEQFARKCYIEADKADDTTEDHIKAIWSRGGEKARKLAALVAVGYNPYMPVVTAQHMKWAVDFVQHDIAHILAKLNAGETGKADNETDRLKDMKRCLAKYLAKSHTGADAIRRKIDQFAAQQCVPLSYLTVNLSKHSSFRNVRNGNVDATKAVQMTAEAMVALGYIKPEPMFKFSDGSTSDARVFRIVDPAAFQ